MNTFIDSHIHLDQYKAHEREWVIAQDNSLAALISVSTDFASCKKTLELALTNEKIMPAFGWHPEQPLLAEVDLIELLQWMEVNQKKMTAVGEVGLPYYVQRGKKEDSFPLAGYLEVLEQFIIAAKKWDKPIILHAIYEDAPLVCELLEKHSFSRAHFHWFKGDEKTILRMRENGYYLSVTPEIIYKERSRELIKLYPLEQILVETDGPWPFEGPFSGMRTHPSMIHHSVKEIAAIKQLSLSTVYRQLLNNTKQLYRLPVT